MYVERIQNKMVHFEDATLSWYEVRRSSYVTAADSIIWDLRVNGKLLFKNEGVWGLAHIFNELNLKIIRLAESI